MNVGFIKKLINVLEESKLEEIEFQRFWTRVRISKNKSQKGSPQKVSVTNLKTKETQELSSAEEVKKEEDNLHIIRFYVQVLGNLVRWSCIFQKLSCPLRGSSDNL